MLCAVVGKRYLWFFHSPNKAEGRKRANVILFFEEVGTGDTISGFGLKEGYWQAKAIKLDDGVKDLIGKTDKTKVVEIKRRRNQTIDALYLTRLQKERWSSE